MCLRKVPTEQRHPNANEQSGIQAGDGGFQVDVKGNTDLKGSVIASTDKAVTENRNSFTTGGTLTNSDIQNSASYNANSAGISVGGGASARAAGISGVGAGIGSDKGQARSTTKSGLSGIAANILHVSTAGESSRPDTDCETPIVTDRPRIARRGRPDGRAPCR